MLTPPKGFDNFEVYCDALIMGLGVMLMHRGRVVVYVSRQLKLHEANYLTQELDLGQLFFP